MSYWHYPSLVQPARRLDPVAEHRAAVVQIERQRRRHRIRALDRAS